MIVLERDVRDVIVSSYFERVYRGHIWNYKFRGNMSAYLRTEWGGFDTLLGFRAAMGAALEKVSGCATTPTRLYYLTYERLTKCPACELRALCRFLVWTPAGPLHPTLCDDEARIALASRRCTFSTLKKEAAGNGKWGEAIRGQNQSSKIRQGQVGGYRSELSLEDQAWLEARIANSSLAKSTS